MRIEEILAEKVIQDYYTANIKTEVSLDMILTPVISQILTAVGRENRELGINGEMKLIAKEFPMLKSKSCAKTGREELKETGENGYNYRNCNADYLMCDDQSVYFVELKTTQESFDHNQMVNYQKYLAECKDKKFSDVSGADFIELLNHVTGYSRNSNKKPWGKTEKNDLKRLFEAVIHYPQYTKVGEVPLTANWEKEESHHVNDAITYLKKTKAVSSKKYLLTAGQMLDHMIDGKWWDCEKIKLLYLMPEKPSEEEIKKISEEILKYYQQGIFIIVTFREIMEQVHVICTEADKKGLKNYWEWVMEILIQCGLY